MCSWRLDCHHQNCFRSSTYTIKVPFSVISILIDSFDRGGNIVKNCKVESSFLKLGETNRQSGTKLIITNIFSNLPVRFQEIQKHIRKEMNKIMEIVYGFSIISVGVSISLINK
jgi:DNA mismatch repair ATPase MutL